MIHSAASHDRYFNRPSSRPAMVLTESKSLSDIFDRCTSRALNSPRPGQSYAPIYYPMVSQRARANPIRRQAMQTRLSRPQRNIRVEGLSTRPKDMPHPLRHSSSLPVPGRWNADALELLELVREPLDSPAPETPPTAACPLQQDGACPLPLWRGRPSARTRSARACTRGRACASHA